MMLGGQDRQAQTQDVSKLDAVAARYNLLLCS